MAFQIGIALGGLSLDHGMLPFAVLIAASCGAAASVAVVRSVPVASGNRFD